MFETDGIRMDQYHGPDCGVPVQLLHLREGKWVSTRTSVSCGFPCSRFGAFGSQSVCTESSFGAGWGFTAPGFSLP